MIKPQGNNTPAPPSRRSIVTYAVLSAASLTVLIWMLSGPDTVEVNVGSFGWALLFGACTGEMADRVIKRGGLLVERTLEQARNTGTWRHPEPQEPMVAVRWDPGTGWYWIRDEACDDDGHCEPRPDMLRRYVVALESTGFVPASDEGTCSIRERLGITGPLSKPGPY